MKCTGCNEEIKDKAKNIVRVGLYKDIEFYISTETEKEEFSSGDIIKSAYFHKECSPKGII